MRRIRATPLAMPICDAAAVAGPSSCSRAASILFHPDDARRLSGPGRPVGSRPTSCLSVCVDNRHCRTHTWFIMLARYLMMTTTVVV